MKKKLFALVTVVAMLASVLGVAAACAAPEQDLSGMFTVTYDLDGGTLNYGVNTTDNYQIAYMPNSEVIDISNYRQNRLLKTDFQFVGWYKDKARTQPWNFETDRVTEDITLYAKWEEEAHYHYEVILVVGSDEQTLYTYDVHQGEVFSDWLNMGTNLASRQRTFTGFFADKALTQPWDETFTHPGGETETVPVYVDSIEGVWTLVSTYEQLNRVASNAGGTNIMLTADIDCSDAQGNPRQLYFGNYGGTFTGKDNKGVQHKISNCIVPIADAENTWQPAYSLFGILRKTAKLQDLVFENVTVVVTGAFDTEEFRCAALAQSVEPADNTSKAEIVNVSVSGTYTNSVNVEEFEQWIPQPTKEDIDRILSEQFGKLICDDTIQNATVTNPHISFSAEA